MASNQQDPTGKDPKHFIWTEKYRPKTIEECVLPESIKKIFRDIVKGKELPSLMLCGSQGIGKTTVALALCDEMGLDRMYINASEENSIDTLRTKIKSYASSISVDGRNKVVLLDEADGSGTSQSFQPALRAFMEQMSKNCRFILTANHKNRIIEPIHSRCSVIEWKYGSKEKPELAKQFFDRCRRILDKEGIEYDSKVVACLVSRFFPDFRRVVNELQKYSIGGKIDEGILSIVSDVQLDDLLAAMKGKKFAEVRKWVVQNIDSDANVIFRKVYDAMYVSLSKASVPQAIIIIADYMYRHSFCADPEVNLMACLIQVMAECEFL